MDKTMDDKLMYSLPNDDKQNYLSINIIGTNQSKSNKI